MVQAWLSLQSSLTEAPSERPSLSRTQFLHSQRAELCWLGPHTPTSYLSEFVFTWIKWDCFLHVCMVCGLFIKQLILNVAVAVVKWHRHAFCKTYYADLQRQSRAPSECVSDYYFHPQHVRSSVFYKIQHSGACSQRSPGESCCQSFSVWSVMNCHQSFLHSFYSNIQI